jgi:hypothetical protein
MIREHFPVNLYPSGEDAQQGAVQEATRNPLVEQLQQVRSDALRTRLEVEHHIAAYQSHVRKTLVLWLLTVALTAGVAGLAWFWFAYPHLRKDAGVQSESPALEQSVAGLQKRLAAAEAELDAGITSSISMGERIARIEARLDSTPANPPQQSGQTPPAPPPSAPPPQRGTGELSGLKRQNHTATNKVAGRVPDAVRRVDFEVSKNRTEQVAPDIYLTIKEADATRQRIDGWMQLAREGRIVWIRENGIKTPLEFVTEQDRRIHSLVFTRIGKESVAGYLLLPLPASGSGE